MVHVQAVTLRLSPESEKELLGKVGTFCNRPENLYRQVVRHNGLVGYCLPPETKERVKLRLTEMQSSFFPISRAL